MSCFGKSNNDFIRERRIGCNCFSFIYFGTFICVIFPLSMARRGQHAALPPCMYVDCGCTICSGMGTPSRRGLNTTARSFGRRNVSCFLPSREMCNEKLSHMVREGTVILGGTHRQWEPFVKRLKRIMSRMWTTPEGAGVSGCMHTCSFLEKASREYLFLCINDARKCLHGCKFSGN